MTKTRGIRAARFAGLLVGAVLALAFVWDARPGATTNEVGATVSFHANMTGELAVDPAGPEPFHAEHALKPGEETSGSFEVKNQTGEPQSIRLQALSSDPVLDELLAVELRVGDELITSGPLGSQRTPSTAFFTLDPGLSDDVTVTAELAPTAGPIAAAALVDVGISFTLGYNRKPRKPGG